jgi:serine/threonine protein phosphatase 1
MRISKFDCNQQSLNNSLTGEIVENDVKITWVIGDIHGVYDPLRYLIDSLLEDGRVEKFVFVGDYIDHGPSSKEVIDLIMKLDKQAVTLLGNHELLLLDTLYNEEFRQHWGPRIWRDNGGDRTARSFGANAIEELENMLDEKYRYFFQNLTCTHVESVQVEDKTLNFLIVHAGVMPKISLQEQLAVKNFSEHNEFIKKHKIWVEDSFTWIRERFYKSNPEQWNGYVVIHGHTPTHLLNFVFDGASAENEETLLLPYMRYHPKQNRVVSIDIDTGSAFGKRLTALGLPNRSMIEKNGYQAYLAQIDYRLGYYRQNPIRFKSFPIAI